MVKAIIKMQPVCLPAQVIQHWQIFVPVRAIGNIVYDNGGDPVATCATDLAAAVIADLINRDAGVAQHG